MIGRAVAAAYVLTVAALAAVGFVTESTAPILVAGVLSLPTSVPAVIAFYVVYGLLAQVPGANPDSSSGSSSGDLATWFAVTTDVVGVLALTAAAVVNVVVVARLLRRRALAPRADRSGARP